jgi:hypothetical protein
VLRHSTSGMHSPKRRKALVSRLRVARPTVWPVHPMGDVEMRFARILFALLASPAAAEPMTCRITTKHSCDPAGGCKKIPPGVWNVLDAARQTYARCDARGCDTYDASFSPSGAFIVIDVPSRGMVAKVAADKSSFLEVATLGMTALNSFGSCE